MSGRSLKKNLKRAIDSSPERILYFFDESRFGTHSKLGHGWFETGLRTPVKIKLGFQNFYLYSAVSPASGEDFTLLAPKVNTSCMNAFLRAMSEHLGARTALIVMDCAGWHKARGLVIPENISIMYLPPYSPELNPVERLWQHLKSTVIKNKIYDTLDDLEQAVCDSVCKLNHSVIKSICASTHLLY